MSTQSIAAPPVDTVIAQTEAERQAAEKVHDALCGLRDRMEMNFHETDTAQQLLVVLQQQKRQLIDEAKQLLASKALRDPVLDVKQADLEHLEDRDGELHAKRAAPLKDLAQAMKKCRREERRILAFALRKRWLWWV